MYHYEVFLNVILGSNYDVDAKLKTSEVFIRYNQFS